MKLAPRDLPAFVARPDPRRPGILIHGSDPLRIAHQRRDLIAALIGPAGEAEMRLQRLAAADLRRDPAALQDALRARGFFPGARAVLLEEAGDAHAPVVADALAAWAEGDAMLVVTAEGLTAASKLRTLFEKHPRALAAAIYDDPPGPEEIAAELRRAGLTALDRAAAADLEALGRSLEPGDFRQTLEKIALYKLGDPSALTADEVQALAPATIEAETDALVLAVADGRVAEIGPLMLRLSGQGVLPVTLLLAMGRHLRALHAAACDPEGPAQGIARARPPVLWKLRDRMARQAGTWGRDRIETALGLVLDTDLALRSADQTAPPGAVAERLFIRLATLARSR
jgi:DNA polymerase-3 subunit delta